MQLRFFVAALIVSSLLTLDAAHAAGGTGSCFRGRLGTTIDCGGGYVVPSQPAPSPTPSHNTAPTTTIPLAYYVANGPNGPCLALGPANPAPNATVSAWLATVQFPNCPPAPAGPAPPALNPQAIAVQFWQTIPLPAPKPDVPPGYAITGKTAYLVTNGSVAPPPYTERTPLGILTIRAAGSYTVDWGDAHDPSSAADGPYPFEGQPWPNGRITHVYDFAGSYTVTVTESWTARWSLAGAQGTLVGLRTTATIPTFRVEQLQAVLTN